MLSYRHGFHAGNQADVIKHAVLVFCLGYLTQKPKPLWYIDTHAGAGSYTLDSGFAAQNREWARGIGAMAGADAEKSPPMIRRYLELVRQFRGEEPGRGDRAGGLYPGSPLAAAALLRAEDRGRCFELHPADFGALQKLLAGDRRFRAEKEDGLAALKALLPPPPRRALIFIDPSYELKEDYPRLVQALGGSLARFPAGLYIVWYPLLEGAKAGNRPYGDTLMGLYRGTRCRVELRFGPSRPGAGGRLYGCGLVIFNPPWTLRAALGEAMPVFAARLGGGEWELRWEERREPGVCR
jgi:23S rRNA (adenine2030-N6)-methyltransferase